MLVDSQSKTGDVERQARLQVRRFVLMNHIALGKLVQHATHDGKHRGRLGGVLGGAELTHGVARSLMLVAVAFALLLVGTEALEG